MEAQTRRAEFVVKKLEPYRDQAIRWRTAITDAHSRLIVAELKTAQATKELGEHKLRAEKEVAEAIVRLERADRKLKNEQPHNDTLQQTISDLFKQVKDLREENAALRREA